MNRWGVGAQKGGHVELGEYDPEAKEGAGADNEGKAGDTAEGSDAQYALVRLGRAVSDDGHLAPTARTGRGVVGVKREHGRASLAATTTATAALEETARKEQREGGAERSVK